ncbi:2-C-methyl-D-erythritol 2,4-cyclodiphosphate synthase [Sphaerochaeta sp.]|uniref:2-C-methyl-D-erythritol 2,4-cyclodiphosphate synthase n=1 Tax=Sphaerochaeta sp. TaxID=1972642 RepID=UPI003D104A5A
MRIGTGWDLHRLVSARTLILGGVVIPSDKGEAAHSDGDVLIHAIIDALLGSLAKGDIGSHFPDTDPAYKDADSIQLLKKVLTEDLPPHRIENIDTTIILQRPKLRPYIEAIRESLANVLGLELHQVSVKAKTAEGILGELGSGDAVIAQASVLIS